MDVIRKTLFLFVLSTVVAGFPHVVTAAPVKNAGLSIAPLRQEVTAADGGTVTGSVLIGNQTTKTMNVTLSVSEYTVADYSYSYIFGEPEHDWVKMQGGTLALEPHKLKKVGYTITVPERATPGGYYFAIFASTQVEGEGLPGTAQVVSLLYLTVKGELVRTGVLQNDTVPFLVTGSEVPYRFDVKDTGNIYFSAYFYGQLQGLFGQLPESGTSHLLMPGAVRTIDGEVPAPLLPGIYKFNYGYKVDFASIVIGKSTYILYIPPWSVIALVLMLLVAKWLWQRYRKAPKPKNH